MTESRKQFEEWFKQSHTENVQKVDDEYVHGATERLWQAWQASRAAIVVNLGSAQNTSFEEWQVYHEDEIKDELKRLGVSYE